MSEWAYIGRTTAPSKAGPAGFIIAVSVDCPEMAQSNAKEIAKWVRAGYTVERVPVEWVRKHAFTTTPYAREDAP